MQPTLLITDPPSSLLSPRYVTAVTSLKEVWSVQPNVAVYDDDLASDVKTKSHEPVLNSTPDSVLVADSETESHDELRVIELPSSTHLTVKELKDACRARGLKTTGRRSELEERLAAASSDENPSA